jgi:DNA polymerase III subunit beta
MHVVLLSENLNKKISFINHAISSRPQLPVLSCFLIKAKENKLTISGTDLETGTITEIPAKIIADGEVAVPAKTFIDFLSTIPLGKITLEKKEDALIVKTDRIRAKIQTITPEDFPNIYEEKGKEVLKINVKEAKKDFSRVVFAASMDTERPVFSGVLIKREEGEKTIIAATDGHRLSVIRKEVGKKENKEEVRMIVPSRVVKEFLQMEEEEEVSVNVAKEKNQIIFLQKEDILVGRLIEGDFPNYERIIPTGSATRTEFDRQEMIQAIKSGYVFARQTAGIVKLKIEKEKVVVSANSPTVGENTIDVESRLNGEENEIAFNARYVLDFLSNTEEEKIVFEMTNPLSPGVFREKENLEFLHLIMPIRIQQD